MNTYIGVDLGTSSIKLLLVNAKGNILSESTCEYKIFHPQKGWSEQNPENWWSAFKSAISKLLINQDRSSIKAISFGGQMHGLVMLDGKNMVIRPCILWNDGRTEKQVNYLNDVVGKEKLLQLTSNIAFAGFTAPKVLWIAENEPDNYKRISKIMLPKDYLAFRLSGVHATDFSDASGTLFLDVKNKCWSEEMCRICGVKLDWLPKLHESYEAVGKIIPEMAEELGLDFNVQIVAGAGDNAAAAIGMGTIDDGACNISIGTSGTVFVASDGFKADNTGAIHSFCHSNGCYHQMGCVLSAASCVKWWMENIVCSNNFASEQNEIEQFLGNSELYFLPYLMGERSPHNDVNAKSLFLGMRPNTSKTEMLLAIFEGVAFAIKDCIEAIKQNGINIKHSTICGGGAKSEVWKAVFANVLDMEISALDTEQGPAYGAAILAMCGAGEYSTINNAVQSILKPPHTLKPSTSLVHYYAKKYKYYKKLYPAIKSCFEG